MIDQITLKSLLNYNPLTGVFTRITNCQYRNFKKGDAAGIINNDGYIEININGERYLAHRLAFLFMIGRFPFIDTDHINQIKTDNTWLNLRDANKSQNQQNLTKCKKNNLSTGILGVYIRKDGFIYSKIKINRKQIHLGYFNSIKEAESAYLAAKTKYHPFSQQ